MTNTPLPSIQSPAARAFAAVADQYCQVIERRTSSTRERFLQDLHALLPRLYAAALALPPPDLPLESDDSSNEDGLQSPAETIPSKDPDRGQTEEWMDLYTSLGSYIGSQNHYREIFDPYAALPEPEVTGSLADDLADIYRDVRSGLRKWQRGENDEALWEWRFNFESHWGEHVTGALRALYVLTSTYDLGWPKL